MEAEPASIVAFSRRKVIHRNWDIGIFGDTVRHLLASGEVDCSKNGIKCANDKDGPWRQIQETQEIRHYGKPILEE